LEHPTLAPFAILPGRDRSDVRSAQEIEHVIRASRHPDADELVAAIPVLARLP
jgi:hypothetical protein